MARHKWNYNGDINLRYGGFWWKEDDADDYVLAVRVTPCSDGGGPDNLYLVEQGSIYMPLDPAKRHSALQGCGYENEETPSRSMLVDAFMASNRPSMAYWGIERDTYNGETVIQIGKHKKDTSRDGWSPEPDVILRGNASLERYVRANFL